MKSAIVLLAASLTMPLMADEGMWPFNQFPSDVLNQKHKFQVPPDFLDNLRLASVKLPEGSGAFVSPSGLVLTDRRTAGECLSKLSTPGHDYVKEAFYASTSAAELRCPDLDARVLVSIEDVTSQVKGSGKDNSSAQALDQRNSAIARIEKDCNAKTGYSCEVVKLFSGGRYDLYQYQRYTDLRLVFAPEYEVAFFGKQRDSITYLRYGLDIAFLRAYENGKAASTQHYLKWSAEGVKDGDLVFAAGDPAPTGRLATAAQLLFYRDTALPFTISRLDPRIRQLAAFALQSADHRRAAEPLLAALENDYKQSAGKLIGLRDDRMVARKTTFEGKVRHTVERDPKYGTEGGKVWDQVATAYKNWAPFEREYQVLDADPAPGSELFRIARSLVRSEDENSGANDLAAGAPVSDEIETMMLARYLDELQRLGDKEAPLKEVLGGKNSQQAAENLVKSTKLKDPEVVRQLAANREAVRSSDDPMIRFVRALDEPARRIHKKRESMIGTLETSAAEKIAQYRFKLFGAADYPDATGTPRVEFGLVKGYTDRAGIATPFASTFGGLFYRRNNQGPYEVPDRWVELRSALNLAMPLDFVSTCDIGGGDYGSPTVNRAGELVGVTFDGNLESLPDTFLYSDEQARAVHVAVQGITEALGKVYKAQMLLDELGIASGGRSPRTAF